MVVVLGILVLAAFLIWASIGTIPTKVSGIGWVSQNEGVVYIPTEKMQGIDITKEVLVEGSYHKILGISDSPISVDELKKTLSKEAFYRINPTASSYEVRFEAVGLVEGAVVAGVVTDNINPISFILSPNKD